MTDRKKIGEMLLEQGSIDKYQLKAALNRQERWGKKLGETLVEMGFISDEVLLKILSKVLNMPSIRPEKFEVSKGVLSLIPKDVCTRLLIVPLAIKTINSKKRLVVAMADPTNYAAIDEIQFLTNLKVLPMVCTSASFEAAMIKYYGSPLPAVNGDNSEVSIISRVTNPGEYMEIIRQGREDKVKIESSNPSEPSRELDEVEQAKKRAQKMKGEQASEFGKDLEEKLKNFEIEEVQAKPEPFASEEYEESTGIFRDENSFNKLVKILKYKSILNDGELKSLIAAGKEFNPKSQADKKGLKMLVDMLHSRNVLTDKEKKILDED